MLELYCGEDGSASRVAYYNRIQDFRHQGYEVIDISPGDVPTLIRGAGDEQTLFAEKKVFVTANIEKIPFRKSAKIKKDGYFESLSAIASNNDIILLSWESDKPSRSLKLKDIGRVFEFKPIESLFAFLDIIYPGNKAKTIASLRKLIETQEEMFVFIMLQRHIRSVLKARAGTHPSSMSPWQRAKLNSQSSKWDETQLSGFYHALIRLEIGIKSSLNPYGIRKSIEILACHYL